MNIIKEGILIFDGAMGTMLQNVNLEIGKNPEAYNITHSDKIQKIHEMYIEAGANVITTNTFGANDIRFKNSSFKVEDIVRAAVAIAKKAKGESGCFIALDVGPLGEFIKPKGNINYEDAISIFEKEVKAGVDSGVNLIIIETMMDLNEMRAAVTAAKKVCDIPIFATMTFKENGKTIFDYTIEDMVAELENLGVDALGFNCSESKAMISFVKRAKKITKLPIIAIPNAGIPEVKDNKLIYKITKEQFLEDIKIIIDSGARIIGGCCGTTPEFIKELSKKLNKK